MLLNLGASVKHVDRDGNSCLHHAAAYGHIPIVRLLLHRGADAFTKNNSGYTASDYAYSFEVEQEIQNTVRSILETNKRARKAQPAHNVQRPVTIDMDNGETFEQLGQTPLGNNVGSSYMQYIATYEPLSTSRLQLANILSHSPTMRSNSPAASFGTPVASMLLFPQSSPALNTESNRAYQRIFARGQGQAEMHSSTPLNRLPESPPITETLDGSSVFRTTPLGRDRSLLDELTFASTSYESTLARTPPLAISSFSSKAGTSPQQSQSSEPPSPSPLTLNAPSTAKGGTLSVVSRLRRSGSNGSASILGRGIDQGLRFNSN